MHVIQEADLPLKTVTADPHSASLTLTPGAADTLYLMKLTVSGLNTDRMFEMGFALQLKEIGEQFRRTASE